MRAGWRTGIVIATITVMAIVLRTSRDATRGEDGEATRPRDAQHPLVTTDADRTVTNADRDEALARAQVWIPPKVPVAAAYFGVDPSTPRELTCRFKVSTLGGTTPKFNCELANGEMVRVKYGSGGEIPAETAASALLRALGFGADEVQLVQRLRCYGCPDEPFLTMKATELTGSASFYERSIDFDTFKDYEWVSIERKFPAPSIETEDIEGWGFFELEKVDSAKGGAARAHVDAMRLLAVFLAHWDNKPENQRLVCLTPDWQEGSGCTRPFLLLHDVGATFGPRKLDLASWEKVAIWQDRATCTLSMRELPHGGATFRETRVLEDGRQFLGRFLSQLSERQLTDLFITARFDHHGGPLNRTRPVADWVRVFKEKVTAITAGLPCP
jgi:hypothetical protein